MSQMRPVQVIAVSGGKGGVGKSNISVNLGIALAELRRRVVLLDADLGLANVDVLLGLKATHTLADVFAVCDRLTVMHRGRKVTEKRTTETNTQELVQYMVGALDDTRAQ